MVVIAPTRELAMQGVQVATRIGSHLPDLKLASFIGGLPPAEDRVKAQRCQLAVGTPGRLRQVIVRFYLLNKFQRRSHSEACSCLKCQLEFNGSVTFVIRSIFIRNKIYSVITV